MVWTKREEELRWSENEENIKENIEEKEIHQERREKRLAATFIHGMFYFVLYIIFSVEILLLLVLLL